MASFEHGRRRARVFPSRGNGPRRIIISMKDGEAILPDELRDATYYGEQDENGVDLSLIRENLKLTPTERARKGDRAAHDTLRLMEYARRNRQEQTRTDR